MSWNVVKTMHDLVNDEHKAGQQSRISVGLTESVHSVICSVNWLLFRALLVSCSSFNSEALLSLKNLRMGMWLCSRHFRDVGGYTCPLVHHGP